MITLNREIKDIEELINPNYIHSKRKKQPINENDKNDALTIFFSKYKPPTTKEKIIRILEYRTTIQESLNSRYQNIQKGLSYGVNVV